MCERPMPPVKAKCTCGKCTVTQRRPGGMTRWACHCKHCQAANAKDPVTQGLYGANSADWWCNVVLEGPTVGKCTTFAPCGCPCPLWCAHRRECAECGQPLVAWGHGALTGVAIVNNAVIQRALPEASLKPKFENFCARRHDPPQPCARVFA